MRSCALTIQIALLRDVELAGRVPLVPCVLAAQEPHSFGEGGAQTVGGFGSAQVASRR